MFFKRLLSVYLVLSLCIAGLASNVFAISTAYLDSLNLPEPGLIKLSNGEYNPVILRGVQINDDNPLEIDFIIDHGDADLSQRQLQEETDLLVEYFLAGLTTPEKDLWVNLSPYESNRVVNKVVAHTNLGKELLVQDYILKQISSSLTHPETESGKAYWQDINSYNQNHGTDLSKIWISPRSVELYADAKRALIGSAVLKVESTQDQGAKTEKLLQAVQHEVNQGKSFQRLRQLYHSLILAQWYKKRVQGSMFAQLYSDKQKVAGIDSVDPSIKNIVYDKYLNAYENGTYNVVLKNNGVKRSFFSGGLLMNTTEATTEYDIAHFPSGTMKQATHTKYKLQAEEEGEEVSSAITNSIKLSDDKIKDINESILREMPQLESKIENLASELLPEFYKAFKPMSFKLSDLLVKFMESSHFQGASDYDMYIETTLLVFMNDNANDSEQFKMFFAANRYIQVIKNMLEIFNTANISDQTNEFTKLISLCARYDLYSYFQDNLSENIKGRALPVNNVENSKSIDLACSTNAVQLLFGMQASEDVILNDLSLYVTEYISYANELLGTDNFEMRRESVLDMNQPEGKVGLIHHRGYFLYTMPGFNEKLNEMSAWLEPNGQIVLEFKAGPQRQVIFTEVYKAIQKLIQKAWELNVVSDKDKYVHDQLIFTKKSSETDSDLLIVRQSVDKWNSYLKLVLDDLVNSNKLDLNQGQEYFEKSKLEFDINPSSSSSIIIISEQIKNKISKEMHAQLPYLIEKSHLLLAELLPTFTSMFLVIDANPSQVAADLMLDSHFWRNRNFDESCLEYLVEFAASHEGKINSEYLRDNIETYKLLSMDLINFFNANNFKHGSTKAKDLISSLATISSFVNIDGMIDNPKSRNLPINEVAGAKSIDLATSPNAISLLMSDSEQKIVLNDFSLFVTKFVENVIDVLELKNFEMKREDVISMQRPEGKIGLINHRGYYLYTLDKFSDKLNEMSTWLESKGKIVLQVKSGSSREVLFKNAYKSVQKLILDGWSFAAKKVPNHDSLELQRPDDDSDVTIKSINDNIDRWNDYIKKILQDAFGNYIDDLDVVDEMYFKAKIANIKTTSSPMTSKYGGVDMDMNKLEMNINEQNFLQLNDIGLPFPQENFSGFSYVFESSTTVENPDIPFV